MKTCTRKRIDVWKCFWMRPPRGTLVTDKPPAAPCNSPSSAPRCRPQTGVATNCFRDERRPPLPGSEIMSTWGVVTSFASLSWHAAILQVQFMQTKTEQNAGNLTFLTPKLFAERAFRTVYNYHKSFRAYVRLWRNTDVTSIVYLQHGGVCRKRHCHPIYTVKQPMSFGSLGCKGIISRP